MKQTVFIFGRTPDLSLLELTSLYPQATLVAPTVALVNEPVNTAATMRLLGGTVKIAEVAARVPELTQEVFLSILLREAEGRQITFGISTYGGLNLSNSLSVAIKRQLTERGVRARFIETKHDDILSSVVVAKQHVVELVAMKKDGEIMIGVNRAVQDFEDWNKRDSGRPAADPKAGMLPPKVARMIVNVALTGCDPSRHPMLLDPFCGVGTILMEASLRGASTIGSDLSEDAVEKAKANLAWMRRTYPETAALFSNVMVSDATHLARHVPKGSIDAIATEPFMGQAIREQDMARLSAARVKNILKGLEKLYIGSLKEWVGLLKPRARVVIAMPAYVTPSGVFRVKNVVDRCERDGYTLLTGPIGYSRPQAVVRREFYIFQKK